MKKFQWILVLLILASVILSSCIPFPEEPQEVYPFCQELYADLLIDDPDFPHAFIGFCVATLQTGDTRAAQGLCGYEGIWEELGVHSRKECIEYFKTYESMLD